MEMLQYTAAPWWLAMVVGFIKSLVVLEEMGAICTIQARLIGLDRWGACRLGHAPMGGPLAGCLPLPCGSCLTGA
uniref:Uncharacterized protein n=1 Tax=Leersia perrieri TaxID=77586 RepID=A0A0D9VCZ7_9ORYZ